MKKEAIMFLIGLLIGAIISTSSILLYSTLANSDNATPAINQAPNGQGGMQNGTTPPDKPTGNNTQTNN